MIAVLECTQPDRGGLQFLGPEIPDFEGCEADRFAGYKSSSPAGRYLKKGAPVESRALDIGTYQLTVGEFTDIHDASPYTFTDRRNRTVVYTVGKICRRGGKTSR